MRFGETMREAAVREVKEETGLDIEVGDVIWVGENIGDHGHLALVDFRGVILGGELEAGDDAAEVAWVDVDQIDRYPLTETMYDLIPILGETS